MIAAFFDFDGTLYTGHVWQDLARHHWSAKQHRRWVVAYVARNMSPVPLYKLGLMSQEDFYRAWGETMAWLLRGWPLAQSRDLFERLTDEKIMPNLRDSVLTLLHQHQQQGHLVALVSGTFAPWLGVIASRLGVAHSIGTPLEIRDGCYTGQILSPFCHGPGKTHRIRRYLAEQGLEVDWTASFAYADSGTDLPLLGAVGSPVAVCPDKVLLAHTQSQGWPVIREGCS
jgi:HAD superfamily hydrolase (TIGR01490 family)